MVTSVTELFGLGNRGNRSNPLQDWISAGPGRSVTGLPRILQVIDENDRDHLIVSRKMIAR